MDPNEAAASAVIAAIQAASVALPAPTTGPPRLFGLDPGQVLAIIAAVGVIGIVVFAGWVIKGLPDKVDLETRKIHFAGATFTGILMLFVFASILYFASANVEVGKDIFEKAVTAITPLAGVIVGYLFGARSSTRHEPGDGTSKRETLS